MQLRNVFTRYIEGIPLVIRKVLFRGVVILVCWKVIYVSFLMESRWLDAPLTNWVAHHSAIFLQKVDRVNRYTVENLSFVGKLAVDKGFIHSVIKRNGVSTIAIGDVCNGLELFVLFAGFILCLPGTWIRKGYYMLTGVLIIHGTNVFRTAGLVWVHLQYPGFFDVAHHYLFKMIVYLVTFIFWVSYLRKITFTTKIVDHEGV